MFSSPVKRKPIVIKEKIVISEPHARYHLPRGIEAKFGSVPSVAFIIEVIFCFANQLIFLLWERDRERERKHDQIFNLTHQEMHCDILTKKTLFLGGGGGSKNSFMCIQDNRWHEHKHAYRVVKFNVKKNIIICYWYEQNFNLFPLIM